MPQLWSLSQAISYQFSAVASILFRKYPNDYSSHVVSVDTIDRTVDPETGVLRTERIIAVQQPTPRWMTALLGTSAESYAREVTFVIPSTSAAEETSPPQILVSSINMSLKDFLTCHERISYTAFSPKKLQEGAGQAVEMTTIAEISAQGKLKNGGMAARKLGRKMEDYSIERKGLDSVLERFYPEHSEEMKRQPGDD